MVTSPTAGVSCVECGVTLPAAAKFCPECGTPVRARVDRETRRTVTLLFTDVTGSTAMGEQLDPEAYRGVMGRYFAVARSAVERHGGTVEKFVGDAVLAVFGIPQVREDDALRAVRAASELNEAVTVLSERLLAELGVRLAIRTGVNTGAVVAGSARAGGSFATGDAVNTAARLEQAAAPGEILLGATTYALVRDAVEVEALDPVVAKGKTGPVPAYRLIRVLEDAGGRRGREDLAPIGRVPENDSLDEVFARTATSARTHQVTILGPAGIGKSRLVREFLARVGDRALVAQGRCLSYGQGITYWPLVQALRDVLQLSGTESPELTRHALTEALGPAPDRDEVAESLMALMGKGGTPGGDAQTFWSVRRLVEQLASQRPLVLVVDDLHWAEPSLVELLRRLRGEVTRLPLLLLCQARPELLELHPGWDSGAVPCTTIRLDPLSPVETSASVAALLGGEPPHEVGRAVADWSGGNPLFVEEIVAYLVESGSLELGPGNTWRLTRPLDRIEPSPTVTALLTSRLDRLPPAERDLLERVSVIGLEFATSEAELLVEPAGRPGVIDLLGALIARDLIRPGPARESGSWAFKHVLVRDAAYDGMAKSLRSELHERYADELAAAVDSSDERAGFVAHHLEQAARYRTEVAGRGPEAEVLVDRAVRALVLAADRARDREREDTAISYLERALALGPASPTARREILARRVVSCFEANLIDRLDEALKDFEAELENGLHTGVDDELDGPDAAFLRVMRGAHELATGRAVDPAGMSAAARELVEIGRGSGEVVWIVRGLRAQSICSALLALWRDAAARSEEIIRIGSLADARFARALQVVALTLGDATLREVQERIRAEEALEGPAQRHEQIGTLWDALVAAADCSPEAVEKIAAAVTRGEELYAAGVVFQPTSPLLAEAYAMNHDVDGAIGYLQRVNEGFRRSGDVGHASTYILMQARYMLDRGDPSDSVAPLVEEAATYTSPYDRISVAYLATCRAILAARSGELERSAELAAEALEAADRTDETWHAADIRMSLTAVARAAGDGAVERRMLQEAAQLYRRKEIHSYEAEIDARLAELGGQEP